MLPEQGGEKLWDRARSGAEGNVHSVWSQLDAVDFELGQPRQWRGPQKVDQRCYSRSECDLIDLDRVPDHLQSVLLRQGGEREYGLPLRNVELTLSASTFCEPGDEVLDLVACAHGAGQIL